MNAAYFLKNSLNKLQHNGRFLSQSNKMARSLQKITAYFFAYQETEIDPVIS